MYPLSLSLSLSLNALYMTSSFFFLLTFWCAPTFSTEHGLRRQYQIKIVRFFWGLQMRLSLEKGQGNPIKLPIWVRSSEIECCDCEMLMVPVVQLHFE